MRIETPRGQIITGQTPSGRFTSRLEWNRNFSDDRTNNFSRAQKYVDSEVLRLSDPYVPFDTGMLKKSGILGTVIGSGIVVYITPYARPQYYGNSGRGRQGMSRSTRRRSNNLRGKLWFERMKASHKKEIIDGAKKIARGD